MCAYWWGVSACLIFVTYWPFWIYSLIWWQFKAQFPLTRTTAASCVLMFQANRKCIISGTCFSRLGVLPEVTSPRNWTENNILSFFFILSFSLKLETIREMFIVWYIRYMYAGFEVPLYIQNTRNIHIYTSLIYENYIQDYTN